MQGDQEVRGEEDANLRRLQEVSRRWQECIQESVALPE